MLLHEISDALTGNRYRIRDVAGLSAAMQGLDGVIALLAMPATGSASALKATLEALLGLIDQIPDDDVRRRILVAVTLEEEGLVARKLVDEWDLHRFRGSLVVELDPLCAVTSQDARIWHVQHRIRDRFRLDEQKITGLFPKDGVLRLRRFESAFQRLLGHLGR
jgi:divalent metal cation (Fe/Co/Zn/Cd) transporter